MQRLIKKIAYEKNSSFSLGWVEYLLKGESVFCIVKNTAFLKIVV